MTSVYPPILHSLLRQPLPPSFRPHFSLPSSMPWAGLSCSVWWPQGFTKAAPAKATHMSQPPSALATVGSHFSWFLDLMRWVSPFFTPSLGLSAISLCLLLPSFLDRPFQPLPGPPLSPFPASPSGWVLHLGGSHLVSGVNFHLSAGGSQILPSA